TASPVMASENARSLAFAGSRTPLHIASEISVVYSQNNTCYILVFASPEDSMKNWMVLPCLLLVAAMTAAQTSAPVPAGTALMAKLETTLATFSNKAGDQFQARLTQPVVLNGRTIIPAGAIVQGRVTRVSEPRRISGKPT